MAIVPAVVMFVTAMVAPVAVAILFVGCFLVDWFVLLVFPVVGILLVPFLVMALVCRWFVAVPVFFFVTVVFFLGMLYRLVIDGFVYHHMFLLRVMRLLIGGFLVGLFVDDLVYHHMLLDWRFVDDLVYHNVLLGRRLVDFFVD